MEHKQQGISRLLIIVIFFCLSIFFLNKKKNFSTETNIDLLNTHSDKGVNFPRHVYKEMTHLLKSHNTEDFISFLTQFRYSFLYEIMQKVIEDNTIPLTIQEKVTIVYAMVSHCATKKNIQYDLLDLLLHSSLRNNNIPFLFLLAKSKYIDCIPVFIGWAKDRQKNSDYNNLLTTNIDQAFSLAVEENNYNVIEALFSKKVRISKAMASFLLWHIVENDKNPKLLSLFIRHADADVNYTRNGKTLLVAAVEKNDIEGIRVLLDHGAIVDRIDRNHGTALKLAIESNYGSVVQLLREYGA